MASVFKRNLGNGRKAKVWTIQYIDSSGKQRQCKGFSDKQESERLAFKLEEQARMEKTGLIEPDSQNRKEMARKAIDIHLEEFLRTIECKGRTVKHIQLMRTRLKTIFVVGGLEKIDQIHHENVEEAILEIQGQKDLGLRTVNHYIQSMKEFVGWLVPKRLATNPLLDLEIRNAATDVRKKRRALTSEEISRLVDAARQSQSSVQGFDGEQRARLYLLSYMTGLRKNEIASLKPSHFNLAGKTATVTIEAKDSKHRKKDVLPLHPILAVLLSEWLKDYPEDMPIFPKLGNRKAYVMIRKDLESAGIPYRTKDGDADFHAAGRHTFITELMRNGTPIVVARELARHSDINTTMRYTHIRLDDQAKGIENLPVDPSWTKNQDLGSENLQQIRSDPQCISSDSSGFPGHSESSNVPESHQLTQTSEFATCSETSPCVTLIQRKCPSVTEGHKVEAAGIAPASRDPSVRASTCVSSYLVFVGKPPTGRVPLRLSSRVFSPERQPAVSLWPARIGVSEHDSRAEVMLRSFVTA